MAPRRPVLPPGKVTGPPSARSQDCLRPTRPSSAVRDPPVIICLLFLHMAQSCPYEWYSVFIRFLLSRKYRISKPRVPSSYTPDICTKYTEEAAVSIFAITSTVSSGLFTVLPAAEVNHTVTAHRITASCSIIITGTYSSPPGTVWSVSDTSCQ